MNLFPNKQELSDAWTKIRPYIVQTPVLQSSSLNSLAGANLYFKCENFQHTGAYKMRGAIHAVLNLSEAEKERGVATHSSGNFAQALARSARLLGLKAFIVMPNNAPKSKKAGVKADYGIIIESGPSQTERESKLAEVISETGASFLHPSNNMDVIIGHSSATNEFLSEQAALDCILTPVGGGGLVAGTAIGANALDPAIAVIGSEPKNADDAHRSLEAGYIIPSVNPNTIADGLRTSLGDINFPIIQRFIKEIILVEEEEIISAMRLIWERLKIVIEPSSAVPFAAVLKKPDIFKSKNVGIILTGGNVDIDQLPF